MITSCCLRCLTSVCATRRVDVLLTADQPVDNYWITLLQQYRKGSPNGYAVLHYEGAENATLPATPAPQPSTVSPWTLAQTNSVGAT